MSQVQSRHTITRTASGLATPGLCECGTSVTGIAPRWCIAAEVTNDARPQRPSPNDELYDMCRQTAHDREIGTMTVPERDGEVYPTTREAVSTTDYSSPPYGVSRRLAERQVQTPPWCLKYWPRGYTMARLVRKSRRNKAVGVAPRWCSALKVAARRRTCTLTTPRWCPVAELAPRWRRAVRAAPQWRSTPKIAPQWRTCTLAAPGWRFATELAPCGVGVSGQCHDGTLPRRSHHGGTRVR